MPQVGREIVRGNSPGEYVRGNVLRESPTLVALIRVMCITPQLHLTINLWTTNMEQSAMQPILEHQIQLCALSRVISRHTCFSSSLRCC